MPSIKYDYILKWKFCDSKVTNFIFGIAGEIQPTGAKFPMEIIDL